MLVFRSLTVGLLGACLMLLATRPDVRVDVRQVPSSASRTAVSAGSPAANRVVETPTIIDVAPGVPIAQVTSLLHLAPNEWIASVNDVSVANELDAGLRMSAVADVSSNPASASRFIDLGVEGPTSSRRILVLMH